MDYWLVSIGTPDGGTREITVEAPGEEAAFDTAEEGLEPGEVIQGLIPSPEQGEDSDDWAGGF